MTEKELETLASVLLENVERLREENKELKGRNEQYYYDVQGYRTEINRLERLMSSERKERKQASDTFIKIIKEVEFQAEDRAKALQALDALIKELSK